MAMRAHCIDAIDSTLEAADLTRLLVDLARAVKSEHPYGRLICLLGCHGGVGVTTLAVALAARLAQDTEHKVVLTDLDITSGDLLAAVDLDVELTTDDVVRHLDKYDVDCLLNAVQRGESGFRVLPRPPESIDRTELSAKAALELTFTLTRAFSHAIVDLGSALGAVGQRALRTADDVILVTNQAVPPLRAANRRVGMLEGLGVPRDRIHLVINRYDRHVAPRTDDVEEPLRLPVTATIANDYLHVRKEQDHGVPVIEQAPHAAISHALGLLAARMLGEPELPRRGWRIRRKSG